MKDPLEQTYIASHSPTPEALALFDRLLKSCQRVQWLYRRAPREDQKAWDVFAEAFAAEASGSKTAAEQMAAEEAASKVHAEIAAAERDWEPVKGPFWDSSGR